MKDIQELQFDAERVLGKSKNSIEALNNLKIKVDILIQDIEKQKEFWETAKHIPSNDRESGNQLTRADFNKSLKLQHIEIGGYADCLLSLLDAMSNYPITSHAIIKACYDKLEIKKIKKRIIKTSKKE